MIYKVGLTGLIGSGKSLAASYFAQLGVQIIDTDAIAHELTKPNGAAMPLIVNYFGEEYILPSGALNRVKMRNLVFHNSKARLTLEGVLHPLIFEEVLQTVPLVKGHYVIIMVPLLFKSPKYLQFINRSIFVDCEEDLLIQRVIRRNQLTYDEVKLILASQLKREIQFNLADDVLDNNCDELTLRQQVSELDKKYKDLFV